MIVLDALPGGKLVMDQRGTNTRNLVGADRGAHAAAADRHPALDRPRRHGLGQRDDEVRIVVVRVQLVRTEIDDVVPGRAKPRDQIPFQAKPPMIGGNSHVHARFSAVWRQRRVLGQFASPYFVALSSAAPNVHPRTQGGCRPRSRLVLLAT